MGYQAKKSLVMHWGWNIWYTVKSKGRFSLPMRCPPMAGEIMVYCVAQGMDAGRDFGAGEYEAIRAN
jgi:hypothetical protein